VNAFDGQYGADYAPFFAPVRDADDDGSGSPQGGAWAQVVALARSLGLAGHGAGLALQAGAQAMQVQH
jgi:hypothetical protein